MATSTSKGRKSPGSTRTTTARSSRSTSDLQGTLEKLGIDESVVGLWRAQAKRVVASKIQHSVEDFDVDTAIESAKKYASMSSEKLKEISKTNPKAFYGGIAAILVGASLITAAARTAASAGTPKTGSKGSTRRRTATRSEPEESPLDL
jgi:hypothetical protein